MGVSQVDLLVQGGVTTDHPSIEIYYTTLRLDTAGLPPQACAQGVVAPLFRNARKRAFFSQENVPKIVDIRYEI